MIHWNLMIRMDNERVIALRQTPPPKPAKAVVPYKLQQMSTSKHPLNLLQPFLKEPLIEALTMKMTSWLNRTCYRRMGFGWWLVWIKVELMHHLGVFLHLLWSRTHNDFPCKFHMPYFLSIIQEDLLNTGL